MSLIKKMISHQGNDIAVAESDQPGHFVIQFRKQETQETSPAFRVPFGYGIAYDNATIPTSIEELSDNHLKLAYTVLKINYLADAFCS